MAELTLEPRIAAIVTRNRIATDDVLFLRQMIYADGLSARHEAESLFALESSCANRAPEWGVFLAEMVCDYIVHQEKPSGYISQDNATWLVAMISRDGRVDSETELELLVKVMEAARSTPETLVRFALDQVRLAVVNGDGPLAKGMRLRKGAITRDETDLVRRILYAVGSDGNVAVSRAEAEMLFEINDASTDALNDPSWNELFVKAVANHMMAVSGYNLGSREDALRHEAFLDDDSSIMGGFLTRMFSGGASAIADAWRTNNSVEDRFADANYAREIAAADAEAVTQQEAAWLAGRIGRDGRLHDNERALIEFMRAESSNLHPDLLKVLDKVA